MQTERREGEEGSCVLVEQEGCSRILDGVMDFRLNLLTEDDVGEKSQRHFSAIWQMINVDGIHDLQRGHELIARNNA